MKLELNDRELTELYRIASGIDHPVSNLIMNSVFSEDHLEGIQLRVSRNQRRYLVEVNPYVMVPILKVLTKESETFGEIISHPGFGTVRALKNVGARLHKGFQSLWRRL